MPLIKARQLSAEAFAPYGVVLGHPGRPPDIEDEQIAYWHDVVDIRNLGDCPLLSFVRFRRVPLRCKLLERLPHSIEGYLSLDGRPSVIVVAPSEKDSGLPDLDRVEAFVIEGEVSPILAVNVWHWAPLPLSEWADFALLLRVDVFEVEGGVVDRHPEEVIFAELPERVEIEL